MLILTQKWQFSCFSTKEIYLKISYMNKNWAKILHRIFYWLFGNFHCIILLKIVGFSFYFCSTAKNRFKITVLTCFVVSIRNSKISLTRRRVHHILPRPRGSLRVLSCVNIYSSTAVKIPQRIDPRLKLISNHYCLQRKDIHHHVGGSLLYDPHSMILYILSFHTTAVHYRYFRSNLLIISDNISLVKTIFKTHV